MLVKMFFNSLIMLPTPVNINYWWNYGSLLGLFLMIQIISGLFLSFHYCPNIDMAFKSIVHIMKDTNSGWLIRLIHMNGASFYFIMMYIHISRNIYYNSFKLNHVWNVGIMIFLLSMMTAFMGYVLPWGQMSFWGATVITNLISVIPFIGQMIVEWIWGGYSINNATLNRFYSIHFIMPLIILLLVTIHIFFLHLSGSNNPMNSNSNKYKIPFHPYFTLKDSITMIIMLTLLLLLILQNPYFLGDPDNFIEANPMVTPPHIKPEWYFLFAYSILRSINNKLGGVILLISSILILFILPLYKNYMMKTNMFYPLNQFYYWFFIMNFILLTWLGGQMIEYPFIIMNKIFTLLYFNYYITYSWSNKFWDKLLK
uniref:cytochrome b n=1 Tax=Tetrapedia diversipes TaxID=889126 RepID=UPI001EF9E01C|nr:cytochrome b [Tetrapedia diversipes]UKG21064.1 cytochrome b [Tetrapedia diversipes]